MTEQQLRELFESLTLEEKIGQLLQLAPFFFKENIIGEITGPMEELGITNEDISRAGSVLGIGGAKEMKEIQSAYLERSEKKIPLVFMADIIHGYRTIFPIPLGLGCTWDMESAHKMARVSAMEASAGGVHVTFSPMVDLVRDARWGRVMESTGEDPYLNAQFARALVEGYQGDGIHKDGNIAACAKHFAAYGAVESGREYNTVDVSEFILRDQYFPSFKAAVDAGVKLIMTAFNTVLGIPASGNKWLLRDVLRKEWGFKGVVISDYGAVKELIAHGYAKDERDAAKKALEAGVDIEMMSSTYPNHLKDLIENGDLDVQLLDEAVWRILTLKNEIGLFENPYKGASEELEKRLILCDAHRQAAREVAQKSLVLLKNEHVLPLDPESKEQIAIIGPFADTGAILGGWSWHGRFEESVTLADGIRERIGKERVEAYQTPFMLSEEEIEQAVALAQKADVVILAIGESHEWSGEGGSRAFLTLPGNQEQLAEKIFELNKKTVVVLFNGRPLEIRELVHQAPAVLEAWFPGTEGGHAISDILFGDVAPEGRLSISIPYTVGQCPIYYNAFNTGRPYVPNNRFTTHYIDAPNDPLYPFGYGLTYTTFAYSDAKLSRSILRKGETIELSVTVKNTGTRAATETVQLYIRDVVGTVVRPIKELKGFQKVHLAPNETCRVRFTIDETMLRYVNHDCQYVSDPGTFIAMVGPNSKELIQLPFELVE